jgi:pyruvate dehydrogenase E2 component (dihydrolipoamide acetyltransferase)
VDKRSASKPADPTQSDVRVPLTKIRQAIVRSMTASAQIPQFTLDKEVNTSALALLRSRFKDAGTHISYSDLFIAASARALCEHRAANASFDGDAIVRHEEINVAFAIALGKA